METKDLYMTLGQIAHHRYSEKVGDGTTWEDLMRHQREAWEATGETLCSVNPAGGRRKQAADELLRITAADPNQGTEAAKAIDAAFCQCPTWPQFSLAAQSHLVAVVAQSASSLPAYNAEAWQWVAEQASAIAELMDQP